MPFAICIKAGNDTARPIRTLWGEVGRLEPRPSMAGLGYPPHVTLAIYDELEARDALAELDVAFAGVPPIVLSFDAIRWFENDPMVLWAAPARHDLLQQAHAAIHSIIDTALCREHYRPGNWVPHCTLGTAVPRTRRDQALALTERAIAPFSVHFTAADVVRFPPIEVIRERWLG